ncbi:MAG: Zn-dependent protease [Acidobacteria bacterium]|nr:MAG: Zn-dependent protease [Acidobacteriota bacterium]
MKSLLCLLLLTHPFAAQLRPVHTFSIVARDPQTGEIGVAVQSHWFSVGQVVPWAEAGVGAVATQSFVDPSYGKLGLDLLRAGKSAPDTLRALLSGDAACDVRQVGMIDTQGNVATFTGSRDIIAAGGIAGNATSNVDLNCGRISVGRDFAVQANLMSNDKVWPAMAKAYAEAKGDLADRMLAALDAAQSVGGDIRGKQSAALIVVAAKSTGRPWQDRVFDLRVDDAPQPLDELRRLVALQRAYNHMNAGDLAVEHKDNEAALREYSAAEQIASTTSGIPQSRYAEMLYWHAVALVNMQRVDEALPIFAKAFKLEPSWRELTTRLPHSGLLPDDTKLIERIVAAGR